MPDGYRGMFEEIQMREGQERSVLINLRKVVNHVITDMIVTYVVPEGVASSNFWKGLLSI